MSGLRKNLQDMQPLQLAYPVLFLVGDDKEQQGSAIIKVYI